MSSLFDSKFPFGSVPPIRGLLGEFTKRKTYFAFHFDDVMRVNVVRNAWKITHPDNGSMRGFYDSSFWESKKLGNDDEVKRLIREGVDYTSVVCVLVGLETWVRRWVRYEIARAVIDNLGILAVHLHNIKPLLLPAPNPLAYLAVGKAQEYPVRYYLYERNLIPGTLNGEWVRYQDYTDPVTLPRWLRDPAVGYVTPLANHAEEHDYIVDNGHKNIGAWIDRAAQRAGR